MCVCVCIHLCMRMEIPPGGVWEYQMCQLTIEINCTGTITIDFFDHNVQFLFGQLIIEFLENLLQAGGGNETIALFIIETEGLTQLLLHGFGILLHNEFGSQLHELTEFQTTRLW